MPMFGHLHIYERRERWLVGCADLLLAGTAPLWRWRTSRRAGSGRDVAPARILVLRLERIGDLLMTLRALDTIRRRAPEAQVHLVVGSWNASLAHLMAAVDSVETLDVPWLARGARGHAPGALLQRAAAWRRQHFDVAINLEPDIRSNVLLALSGAARRVGYASGGGGALLTERLSYRATSHTAWNAARLVDRAFPPGASGGTAGDWHEGLPAPSEIPSQVGLLAVPPDAQAEAARLLESAASGARLIGVHASGGRAVKQWHPSRFAQLAARLARAHGATVVLTGETGDRPIVEAVKAALAEDVPVLDVSGATSLPVLLAVLQRMALLITGDTGPMHLAAAAGTPTVALFGPSDPARYGPASPGARVVAVDLWCRPCNRVRRPPARCVGRVPDCLDWIDVDRVYAVADAMLRSARSSS